MINSRISPLPPTSISERGYNRVNQATQLFCTKLADLARYFFVGACIGFDVSVTLRLFSKREIGRVGGVL